MIVQTIQDMILNWFILGVIVICICAAAALIVKVIERIADFIILINNYLKKRLVSHK